MDISEIKYGNPNVIQKDFLSRETYLDSLLSDITNYPPPRNEDVIKDELNELVRMVNITMSHNDAEKRYLIYDKHLLRFFKNALAEKGSETQFAIAKLVDDIFEDTSTLLTKIKFHFNRARPFQIASYYKIPLYPYPSVSADSPSYISGHAFQAKIICEVLGNTFPESYGYFRKLSRDISFSRIYLGLHYMSDIDAAMFASQRVLNHSEFKIKYRL